jgi:hypothetical protein
MDSYTKVAAAIETQLRAGEPAGRVETKLVERFNAAQLGRLYADQGLAGAGAPTSGHSGEALHPVDQKSSV